jgi:diguanylate cyclase (GGDEF)-like protein
MTDSDSDIVQATLDLEGSVRLGGELNHCDDHSVILSSTRLVKGPKSGGKLSLTAGSPATLILECDGTPIDVRITAVTAGDITMQFAEPQATAVRNCLAILSGESSATTVAATTTAGASYAQILDQFRDLSLQHLDDKLQVFLVSLANHLFDLSARSKQITSGYNVHYDAMNAVKRNASEITLEIVSQVQRYFDDLTPKQAEHQREQGANHPRNLHLVDLEEFERDLAVDRMVKVGEDLFDVEIECLILRLAKLTGADPLNVRLPIHVAQTSSLFKRALQHDDIPADALPEIFDFYIDQFVRSLDTIYDPLNKMLAEQGIRPGLEDDIRTGGSEIKRPEPVVKDRDVGTPGNQPGSDSAADAHAPAPTPAREGTRSPAAGQGEKFNPDSLYQSVINALNYKREAVHGDAPQGSPAAQALGEGDKLADPSAIADVLSALQHSSEARSQVSRGASLREYLAANRDQIAGLDQVDGLSPDSLNQLDLVDNLFGTIQSQLDVTQELKPTLGNLQIPLAKLALLEPKFFLDREHAARGVVDKLSVLAASANFPNKALESRIQRIVEQIVNNYDRDSGVFNKALGDVEKLLGQQERALERNVERVVKAQEGQTKLKNARDAVDLVIKRHIAPPDAPQSLVDLVDNGWRDLMVLTHIKEGEQSKSYKDHINTLQMISQWLGEQARGEVDEELMLQRGLEAGPLIDLMGQQISTALPTNASHESVLTDLRQVLTGHKPVHTVAVASDGPPGARSPEEVRAKIDTLPRLRRWVRRVEQLETGTWLSYRDKDGQKRRMRLAWVSEAKDRYIFVNERGQKHADLSAVQLARQLGRGMRPPAPAEKLSLVDQSMYNTLEDVQKSLSFSRNHDTLTRLINRKTFLNQMQRALRHAQRRGSQHAVLYIDIDQFELVNDVYDRVNGDQVLLEFSKLLSQLHGKKTSSARIEEDEFGVLLIDRTLEQASEFAEKIRSDIAASSIEIDGERVIFTVSIGVAPILEHSPPVDEILQAANGAMQEAKAAGRDRVQQFHEDEQRIKQYQRDQEQARQDIEHTLETDRFVLRAQPIVKSYIDGRAPDTRHYEMLLGLANPDGSLSSPQEFILAAERYGYMNLVDRWVVREVFSWISHLMDAQKVVPDVSINISGNSVTDDTFMDYLLEQISEFGVGTSKICFEITETGSISNLVKAADFVRALRNIGCKFSIDDFGTGLASHNYLRELPVDYVKIDGTFVTNIHNNRNDYAMARSINDLAHFLGQETIAESVENEEIIRCLQEIGVDYLQGWEIGRPKPLPEVTEELSNLEK